MAIEQLIDHLARNRAILRDTLQSVPAPARDVTPPNGGWSVAQVIQHLVLTDRRFGQLLTQVMAQLRQRGPDQYDVDAFLQSRKLQAVLDRTFKVEAWEAIRPTEDWDAAYAWQMLEEERARLLELIRSATGMPLGEARHPHHILGELNLYEWIAFLGTHEARHAAQIGEIAATISA
jgi:hypothetical protein